MAKDPLTPEEQHLSDLIDSQQRLLHSMYDDLFGPVNVPPRPEPGKPENGPAPAAGSVLPETQKTAETEKQKEDEPEPDPMEQLNALIGLKTIKHDVRELTDFARVQKLRKDQGMKSVPVSLHLVFTGNPGTGKTTVARILGKLYKQIGILESGHLIEVDRSGLVAGYVGQTALKTQEKIQQAMGGVLFIDEAYSLAKKDDTFGEEAIDTILKAMEDHRDDLVVIVAGYTKPMEHFINSNPGLKSRFNKYIEFPDYTVEELEAIFDLNCSKYDYVVDEDIKHQIHALIVARKLTKLENFANAREVRNLFEEIITNQARRVAAMTDPTPDDLRRITIEDLEDTILTGEQEAEKHAEETGETPAEAPDDAEPVPAPAEPEQAPEEPAESEPGI